MIIHEHKQTYKRLCTYIYYASTRYCLLSLFSNQISILYSMELLFQILFSPLPSSAIFSLFALGAAVLVYLNTRPKALRSAVDLNCQTIGIKVRRTSLFLSFSEIPVWWKYEQHKKLHVEFDNVCVHTNDLCINVCRMDWMKWIKVPF